MIYLKEEGKKQYRINNQTEHIDNLNINNQSKCFPSKIRSMT